MFSFFKKSQDTVTVPVPLYLLEDLYHASQIALANSTLILVDMAKDIRDEVPRNPLISKLDSEADEYELGDWAQFENRLEFFSDLPYSLTHAGGLLRKATK